MLRLLLVQDRGLIGVLAGVTLHVHHIVLRFDLQRHVVICTVGARVIVAEWAEVVRIGHGIFVHFGEVLSSSELQESLELLRWVVHDIVERAVAAGVERLVLHHVDEDLVFL